jgi:hypothetical protein
MISKNYNIKISEEDECIIKCLRDKYCINISQFIRQCLRERYEEMKLNGKRKKSLL